MAARRVEQHLRNASGLDCPTRSHPPIDTKVKKSALSNRKKGKSAVSQYGDPLHKRVARCIGYALTLGPDNFDAWSGLALILAARLNRKERAALAYAALSSMPEDEAYRTASLVLFGPIHMEKSA